MANVWVTLLTDEAADVVIGRLTRKGFGVTPLSIELGSTSRGGMCSVLAISIPNVKASEKPGDLITNLMKPLLEGYYWFSIVVTHNGATAWTPNPDKPPGSPEGKSVWERIIADEDEDKPAQ
jgi:hypothetical protein